MATIHLIRHGEPALTGVFLGQLDPALAQTAAEKLGHLKTLSVEIAWSSPLLRARQTAAFLNTPIIHELEDLAEISYGDWSGLPWAEIESAWPELAHAKLSDWLGTTAPNAEIWSAFLDRITAAWHEIQGGPFPAAVVAHQGANAALSFLITGADPLHFSQTYGQVITLEFD